MTRVATTTTTLAILAIPLTPFAIGCWAGDGRPGWMPERPTAASEFYDTALGRDPHAIAIEVPRDRFVPPEHEIVRATAFTEPEVRKFAKQAKQIDVVDYDIVVLHEPPTSIPAQLDKQLSRGPDVADQPMSDAAIVRTGFVDGRWTFVLRDGTWVMAAMGYVDRIRVLLARGTMPPRLAIPNHIGQLVLVRRRTQTRTKYIGLEWILIATNTEGMILTHAHYGHPAAMDLSARVDLPLTLEGFQHEQELYTRGW